MEFIIKGYCYKNAYKRVDETKKSIRVAVQNKQHQESEARQQAIKDAEIAREMHGEDTYVDFREDPNAKEILKIGEEVRLMKRCGEPRERIDGELNPEIAKIVKPKPSQMES